MNLNKTINVMLRVFDPQKGLFVNKCDLLLAAVPVKGDKIAIDINHWAHIAEVYEVVYADEGMVDVNVIILGAEVDVLKKDYENINNIYKLAV